MEDLAIGEVTAPGGETVSLTVGQSLTFGRGISADLRIPDDPQLSREAGLIHALGYGILIYNHSFTHALYIDSTDYRIRLPRVADAGTAGGWMLTQGLAFVGSFSMLRERRRIVVRNLKTPARQQMTGKPADPIACVHTDTTAPLLDLARDTKLFFVALVLCRPWLLARGRAAPIPTTPEIARSILELTDAWHQVERFDQDTAFRRHVTGQVADHLKYLRRKLVKFGLVAPGMRVSRAMVAESLLANDVVGREDLRLLENSAWRTKQEDLWWRE